MILWSKGLGKLVLRMRLAERSSTGDEAGLLVIDGTMGPPTHWDYAIKLDEADVLDFVELLNQPAPVRFVTEARAPGVILRAALASGIAFVWNTLRCFLGVARASSPRGATRDVPEARRGGARVSARDTRPRIAGADDDARP